ncbi:MAG: hypothetical protein C4531_06965 [Desulfurivibrio sp.]|nr:MAG: hypothetical protein C4531_06965 [Desulfurivibrio sp.]
MFAAALFPGSRLPKNPSCQAGQSGLAGIGMALVHDGKQSLSTTNPLIKEEKMKKILLHASLLLSLAIPMPVLAGMEHEHHGEEAGHEMAREHHGDQAGHGMTKMDMEKMAASLQRMQEMRKKIAAAQEAPERKALLQQHMQMMQEAMQTMTMMDEQCLTEHHGMHHGTSAMPMEERMKMMDHGGMMGMMEKKMMLMREMISGLLLQQEMLMK